jgi:hypothetical protein
MSYLIKVADEMKHSDRISNKTSLISILFEHVFIVTMSWDFVSVTAACNWAITHVPYKAYVNILERYWQRKAEGLGDEPVPVQIYPP